MKMFQDNDKTLKFDLKLKDGTAMDLASAGEVEYILTKPNEETSVITKTLGAGVTVADAAAGKIEVALADTDTQIDAGTYDQQVQATLSSGKKYAFNPESMTVLNNKFYPG